MTAYTDGVGFYGFSAFFQAIVNEFGWSQAIAGVAPSLRRLNSGVFAPLTGLMIARLGPLPSVSDLTISAIIQAVRRDKKVLRGRLHVVLPTAIGQTSIVNDVTEREITQALRAIGIRRT